MNRKTAGFTLIELVVVIAIIGIIAATALPRYINLQKQARTAKAQAIYGSIKSAAALARAGCIVELAGLVASPQCTSTGGKTKMDGLDIDMVNQYPDASLTGIIAAAQLSEAADSVTITTGAPIKIDINGGTGTTCRITYAAATSNASGPIAPVITLDTTGC